MRWGSHNDFQRTRGMLRLLASVVGDLWQQRETTRQTQPLIQPCHVRWNIDALRSALTRLWGAAYDSVAAADVIGEKANATLLDEERAGEYTEERVAQGVAAAVLLGSFGGQGERAGLSGKEIRLCVNRPELNWGFADGALLTLDADRAFYLHSAAGGSQGKRYWFGTKPTLTKLLVQYRGQFLGQDFDDEIVAALQKQAKGLKTEPATWKVLVDPQADLPELKSLALLIMAPAYALEEGNLWGPQEKLRELSQKCGTKDRLYRNTLLFLVPSPRGLARLRKELREVAALEAIRRDYGSQLDPEQLKELDQKLSGQRETVAEVMGGAYPHIARMENQEIAIANITEIGRNLGDHLLAAWAQVTDEEEWVLKKVGSVTLQKVGLVPTEGGVRVKDAVEAFLRYTDKPMVASPEAVTKGLAQACQDRVLGIGRGTNPEKLQARRCGEYVAIDRGEEGVWIIPPFVEPPKDTRKPLEPEDDDGTQVPVDPGENTGTTTGKLIPPPAPAPPVVKALTISGNVPLDSWHDVFRCFVGPAARMGLKSLKLGISFKLEALDDQPLDPADPTLKTMREAAKQFGLDINLDDV